MPPPIVALTREMLHNPVTINLERQAGAGGRDHPGGVPGAAGAQVGAVPGAAQAGRHAGGAGLHPHQAPRQPAAGVPGASTGSRPSGSTATARRRSAPRRWPGSRAASYRVLVATDIAARGIDVEALGHVVNFDVPTVPEDYIHRVGRTARAEATGDAFTFVSPEEEPELAGSSAPSAGGCRASSCPTSTTRRGRRRSSRFRSPSGSRRSGPRRRRTGSAPRQRRRGARRTDRRPRRGRRRGRTGRAAALGQHGPGRGGPGSGGRPGGSGGRGWAAGREWRGRRTARGSRRALSSRAKIQSSSP